jgi:uncharacterized protein
MNQSNSIMQPTLVTERIISLDVLRGFAILGILIMNIQSFSMIEAAYINPSAYGDLTGLNKLVWMLSHIFADQKFLSIFSILFGAGILLIVSKAESSSKSAAGFHYRRIFWLFIIGLLHAYIFWHGDILVTYSICALIAFLFIKKSPKTLFIWGLIIFSIASLIYILSGFSMAFWPPESMAETMKSWRPSTEMIQKELAAFRGSWSEQMVFRLPASIKFQTFIFLFYTGWRAGGLMLLGMALFKWDILSAKKSKKFYINLILLGVFIGFPLIIWGINSNFNSGWTLQYSMFLGWQFNYWGSLFVALAYIGVIMMIYKLNWIKGVTSKMALIGRTALSNYLLQTLICTFIFYGHGLKYFGKVERGGQIIIVLAVWFLQVFITYIWMRYFRFGPIEWIWRSLSYWKIQPMRIRSK